MSWRVTLTSNAEKQLRRLPTGIRRRVDIKLLELSNGPYPRGFKKLHRGGFRLRVGDYRVLYDVDQIIQTIAVSEIIHRSEAYR